MTRKDELIELILKLVPVGNADRNTLESHSVSNLENIYNSAKEDHEQAILLEQDELAGKKASVEYLTNQLKEKNRPAREAKEKEQLDTDRKEFIKAFKTLRTFGQTEANLQILRERVGQPFNVYTIKLFSDAGLLVGRVSPPTQAEWDEWAAQDIEAQHEAKRARQSYLINEATPEQLRTAAKKEAEANRVAAQQAQANELDTKLQQPSSRPPLPEFDQAGIAIDAAYLNRLTTTNMALFRALIAKHGGNNVTKRLRDLG